ncbi:MAG: CRISPR-associated protein Cas4 [Candidatus Cloacimonadales bacterium]|jgi:CRISPR-associated exonuclease Cas4|nr:CRISPR-associated protein Cas4 [Candidatus Cloacimonadales bacterium]
MIIDGKPFVTPSEVIEYLYCPRFIYFMNSLDIPQNEDRRLLVQKGREIHDLKMVRNKDYIRKKIGCIDKHIDVYLTSDKLKLVGKMDEVLLLADNTMAPLDYKFAFWEDKLYETLFTQQVLYALLIEEHFQKEVNKAFLVYVRSKNHVEEVKISYKAKIKALAAVEEIFDILAINYFPPATKSKRKCEDCTYRNICIS